MKKILLSLLLVLSLLLASCAPAADQNSAVPDETATEYLAVTEIDHCAVEPDDRAAMSDDDRAAYRRMMDAMLSHQYELTVQGMAGRLDYLLDLMRRSPYYFFLSGARTDGDRVLYSYAYTAEEQQEVLSYMDTELLQIANANAAPTDNELDTILKVYGAVTHRLNYDHERTDNKQLSSPLFDYPADEVYKALRDGKSLCYGFAYILCFALLQRGIDCFTVYGQCRARDMGHMWNIFRYDGAFFHCDPSWDRAEGAYAKLYHFGKTDDERFADTLEARDFADTHLAAYGAVQCDDTRFSIFRDIDRFTYVTGHRFFLKSNSGKEYIFDTSRFILNSD